MANNIASTGRFSSQALAYLGTQNVVNLIGNVPVNVSKYATGTVVVPSPASAHAADVNRVVGSISGSSYNSTRSYFLSRGASDMYADSMTALMTDVADMLGISTQSLLENSNVARQMSLSSSAYGVFNMLRDQSHQVGMASSASNKQSLRAREIRS